jgi:hypothetical protein
LKRNGAAISVSDIYENDVVREAVLGRSGYLADEAAELYTIEVLL